MKPRLSIRVIERIGWIISATLLLFVISPFAYFGLSEYWRYHTGHAPWCDTQTVSEVVSPSGRWIARVRLVACGALAGGPFIEAVLAPNTAVPFLARSHKVFVREFVDDMPESEQLAVHWIDDHSLELRGAPCKPCQTVAYRQPCDSQCRIINDVSGIAVSLKPAEN